MKKILWLTALISGAYFMSKKIGWIPPLSAAGYMPLINKVEKKRGIPHNLLARVAYQESRFRPDIISGKTKSRAGALGIMQIVPKWHPDVNPLRPAMAIPYAGKYLAKMHKRFGSWEYALMGYNWGPTITAKWIKDKSIKVPKETRDYAREILADVNVDKSIVKS